MLRVSCKHEKGGVMIVCEREGKENKHGWMEMQMRRFCFDGNRVGAVTSPCEGTSDRAVLL